MPKYLIQASYNAQGTQGLLKQGGTGRKKAIEKSLKAIGGKIESLYYAFGDHDAVLIIDLPDNVTAAALSLAVGSAGSADLKTTPLLTVAEIDAACKKSVKYSPPG